MLDQVKISAHDTADIAFHRKMESRIVIFDSIQKFSHRDFRLQFLSDFAFQSFFRTLPGSILPPGNSQPSLNSPYPRCVANTFPSFTIIAATTFIVFIFNILFFKILCNQYFASS